ncbi:hypothetical protein FRC0087_00895 [Corynebacterium diphtheriae]|nr:hypothetical protein FRC0087_00895 [Corynebacterium diphtheriae]
MGRPATTALAATLAALLPLSVTTTPIASAQSSQQVTSTSSTSPLFPLDELGRPKPEILNAVRKFAGTLPPPLQTPLLAAVAFYEGTGTPTVALPPQAPRFFQGFWPSISPRCIKGDQSSVGSVIAVPGPTSIPAPGAGAGQSAFVFTALSTAPATDTHTMTVHWFNLSTLRGGAAPLGNNGINPDGPATISGVANTGRGRVIAVAAGTVGTGDGPCTFLPTTMFFEVK